MSSVVNCDLDGCIILICEETDDGCGDRIGVCLAASVEWRLAGGGSGGSSFKMLMILDRLAGAGLGGSDGGCTGVDTESERGCRID